MNWSLKLKNADERSNEHIASYMWHKIINLAYITVSLSAVDLFASGTHWRDERRYLAQ